MPAESEILIRGPLFAEVCLILLASLNFLGGFQ